MDSDRLKKRFFLLMLAVVTILFFYLIQPFFGAVFWACVVGMLFYPVQRRFLRLTGNRSTLAALMTLLLCVVVVVVPTLVIIGSFVQEGAALYERLESGDTNPGSYVDRFRTAFPGLQGLLERFGMDIDDLKERVSEAAITFSQFVAENAVRLGQNTLQFFVSLALMLYMTFFLLRDGPRLTALLMRALPLPAGQERVLVDRFKQVTRATVKGNLVVAIVQGALGGLIFWILGLPAALLWGVVMTILSLIPVVGAGIIWLPVAIYLLFTGDVVDGLILIAFGAVVIGLTDNILRPILVGRDTRLPDYIILLSTLGGLTLFGITGFVIGPLLAALFVTFWGLFMENFNGAAKPVDPPDDNGQT
ncbi:MAG: AI-2E family transporter [Sphingomonadales bacterium]